MLSAFVPSVVEGACGDGVDEDVDGHVDRLDPDCEIDAACTDAGRR